MPTEVEVDAKAAEYLFEHNAFELQAGVACERVGREHYAN
jgi:hypothetical protein